ncbi:MAG: hypothetical protein HC875_20185, partial [Anaerolineales bacterium]|nr:hypothetical protein [Anaerolineales bacterium]
PFRENLKNQTGWANWLKTFMDRGELVPDDVTEAMVRERWPGPIQPTALSSMASPAPCLRPKP